MKRFLENQLRRFRGNFFDVHSTSCRRHHYRAGARAVNEHTKIQFTGNLAALFNEHVSNRLSFRPGLNGDERFAEQVARDFRGLLSRSHEYHAALARVVLDRALAAAASVNLRFYHRDWSAELTKCFGSIFRRTRYNIPGRGDAGIAKNLLCLIFVDFHRLVGWRCAAIALRIGSPRLPNLVESRIICCCNRHGQRREFHVQFQLRTLFVVVAVCAVAFAYPASFLGVAAIALMALTFLLLPFMAARLVIAGFKFVYRIRD
jgi:hypothetical protein